MLWFAFCLKCKTWKTHHITSVLDATNHERTYTTSLVCSAPCSHIVNYPIQPQKKIACIAFHTKITNNTTKYHEKQTYVRKNINLHMCVALFVPVCLRKKNVKTWKHILLHLKTFTYHGEQRKAEKGIKK